MINNQKMSFHLWKRMGRREQSSLRPSKGVSLYLALMTMSIFLALALGISVISFSQLKMARTIGYSVTAFYASDTGIERTLYEISQGTGVIGSHYGETPEETLENGSNYITDIIGPGADCSASTYCIKSIGIYKDTKRAILISR